MAKIPKTKVYNPQKAEAYVGRGVLRNGDTLTAIKGHFSPVPNGPLIKKKGPFKGSSLKNGGSTPAWQRKAGKNPSGGLNAKGRASYNRANPGKPGLKAPQPQGGPRKKSFCARMSGVKGPAKKPNGEPTRKTLALRKWKC
jgi:hypothetical protein